MSTFLYNIIFHLETNLFLNYSILDIFNLKPFKFNSYIKRLFINII